MRILHYALGFPPYSTGGLTKYAVDIALEQIRCGNKVAVLWPGTINKHLEQRIQKKSNYQGIESYELKNPEYLPQIYGVQECDEFQKQRDVSVYVDFLKVFRPDVIHIHTLMGMSLEFLKAAKQLNIKTVYTTHDFFGICPKTTLFFNKKSCKNNKECIGCHICCENALSIKKMKILQSVCYRTVKNTWVIKKIRKGSKGKIFAAEDEVKVIDRHDERYRDRYKKLRRGYMEYIDEISVIHFNSNYMKEIFGLYTNAEKGIVCNITHSGIKNNKDLYSKKIENGFIQIAYLGAIAEYKGFYMLKDALDDLYAQGFSNFGLTIYNDISNPSPYMTVMPPYKYDDLQRVMNRADIVIALHDVSYGFTVLEALSYGVPVMISEEVGAKDLVLRDETGIVCEYDLDDVKNKLECILNNPESIEIMKKNVKEGFDVPLIEEHVKTLIKEFY